VINLLIILLWGRACIFSAIGYSYVFDRCARLHKVVFAFFDLGVFNVNVRGSIFIISTIKKLGQLMVSKGNPIIFFRQVRAEVAKVTWPVHRETGISTVMVLIMVVLAATFFFLTDWIMSFGIGAGIGFLNDFFR